MKRATRFFSLGLATLVCAVLCASPAQAASVSVSGITQSTQSPGDPPNLYGPPTVTATSVDFLSPSMFRAVSANGVFDLEDSFADALLTFTVDADPGNWVNDVTLTESGARNVINLVPGSATAATFARVIAAGGIVITEIDDGAVPVPASLQNNPIEFGFDQSFFEPSTGLWTLDDTADLQGALDSAGVTYSRGVTKFNLFMNNQLIANSQQGTFSFIDKKFISIDVGAQVIPEPTSLALAGLSLGGLALVARRKKA